MRVVVRTVLSECELDALPKTNIREIFELMCKSLLVFEKWYFGLMYRGEKDVPMWVDQSKKTVKDYRPVAERLIYKVKYFPEDVEEELIEKSTIELFFNQIKTDIFKDEIYCPADTCAILASYALQAKYGDYFDEKTSRKPIKDHKLIPDRILQQHRMDVSEWEASIVNMWRKLKGLDNEDAMMEYLKLVQNLEMYGVSFFEIKNKKGTELLLGLNALGLDIYKPEDKLNPTISFPWSEIKNIKFKDRKFYIFPSDKNAQTFTFLVPNPKTCKIIFNLGIGNHALYMKRRKPDTQEVTNMKNKSKLARKKREDQKNKLNREMSAREEVEKREADYKALIESMKLEMERNRQNLLEAQETIRRLQQQLEELQRAKEELEKQQIELREMMERLEHNKNMEAAEKLALEEEIRAKQLEVQRIQEEVQEKDNETRLLQAQVDEARRKEEEMRAEEEARRQRELEEEAARAEGELETVPEGADTSLPGIVDINAQLKEEVKILQEKLNESRDEQLETDLDKIHQINLKLDRNKYKTLAEIRMGNTNRRVELFENM